MTITDLVSSSRNLISIRYSTDPNSVSLSPFVRINNPNWSLNANWLWLQRKRIVVQYVRKTGTKAGEKQPAFTFKVADNAKARAASFTSIFLLRIFVNLFWIGESASWICPIRSRMCHVARIRFLFCILVGWLLWTQKSDSD